MNKSPWKSSAVAVAATIALGLYTSDASALALGRVTVQSALGEPFRAEVEIPEINADEAASLRASVASGAAFRAAGMELSPTIASLKISLQRRADGRYFLRLSSDRAVNEPFLDLVLEASWSSGRVVRDYTMLFDPPNLRQAPPVVTAQAPVTPRVAATAVPAARPAPASAAAAAAPAEPVARAQPPRTETAPAADGRAPAADGQRVTVRQGETAGRIAAAHKPPAISLDQMLVALLRANPDAFVSGNVNRLRSGAVLDLPTADQAGATEPAEARQLLVAQSRDFNEFRRRLAEGAPTAAVSAADRQAGGRVQAQVEEKAGPTATPDKLTLSKGAVQGKAAAETIARNRAAQDDAVRLAELNKNIADLNKLNAGGAAAVAAGKAATPGAAGAAAPAPGFGPAVGTVALPGPTSATAAPTVAPAVAPAAPSVAPAMAAPTTATPPVPTTPGSSAPAAVAAAGAATPPTAPDASATPPVSGAATVPAPGTPGSDAPAAGSEAPAATPPAPAAEPVVVPAPVAAAPAPVETSLVDEALQNPLLPAVGGGLLALLLGFGVFRAIKRKKANQAESSFLESRAEPDSFFGASGGQRIDTAEGGSAVGSSMVYSASQLDAAGDVDPVAEADVYLAYGRDLQAEEILKEALRTTPERVAVHAKLLEIYAKRKEVKAFNTAAEEAFSLTRGQGPEWNHICSLGHEIDPNNPLYTSGGTLPISGSPAAGGLAMGAVATAAASAVRAPAENTPADNAPVASALPPGLDLDLDLDLSPAAMAGTPTAGLPARPEGQGPNASTVAAPTASLPSAAAAHDAGLAADLDTPPSFELPAEAAATAPAAASQTAASDPGMIEFDLSALSLDLAPPASFDKGDIDTAPSKLAARPQDDESITAGFDVDSGEDPLATKLALAEEFSAIGDPDGARSLAEEVRNEASGALKGRAERFLAELS